MTLPLHGSVVASAIGQQVEQMILQAKSDSEARVKHDLSMAKTQLQNMEQAISELSAHVARCTSFDTSAAVDQAFLSEKLEQLEEKWATEVKAMKRDLHRTIQAHNHNSDLMRHHRDAIDEARRKLSSQSPTEADRVDQQIERVDYMVRNGQAKDRALDAFTERLAQLEQQIGELASAMPQPGFGAKAADAMTAAFEDRRLQAFRTGQPSPELGRRNGAAAGNGLASGFNVDAPAFVPGGPMGVPGGKEAEGVEAKVALPEDLSPEEDPMRDAPKMIDIGEPETGEVPQGPMAVALDDGEDKVGEAPEP